MTSRSGNDNVNRVNVSVFELDESGAVKPNPLFHRPWDKLHSRCVEYPFAASQVNGASRILDVGTVKSDPAWIDWLENLPIDVHATDYDKPTNPFRNVTCYQADVRELPIPDNTFDKVLAVSVVEHIGLHNPQVLEDHLPSYNADGDLEAVRELIRVLKTGGDLIMTVPFGSYAGLIGNSARSYTMDSIRKFAVIAEPLVLDYYEYQYSRSLNIYPEFPSGKSWTQKLVDWIIGKWCRKNAERQRPNNLADRPGRVTWRRIPMAEASATHHKHIDGVLCSIWRKR